MGQHSAAHAGSGQRRTWRKAAIVSVGLGFTGATIAGIGLASGTTPAASAVYSAIAPTVVGQYSLAANGNKDVPVAGVDGVPTSATSVQLSVTALNESATGSLYVYATGSTQPDSANLRWTAGAVNTVPITTAIGTSHSIRLHNTTGTAQIKISVIGYYTPAPAPGSAGYAAAVNSGPIADFLDGGTTIASLNVPAGTYEFQVTATMSSTDDATTDQDVCDIYDPAENAVATWSVGLNATTPVIPASTMGLDTTTSGGTITFYCYSSNAHSQAAGQLIAIKLSSAIGYVAGS